MNGTLASTRADWLKQRRLIIGSSDIAALVGLNPYASPVDVYLDKVEGREIEETERMKRGRQIEPVIIEMFRDQTGREVTANSELVVHPEYTFAGATPDAMIGSDGILECKNTGSFVTEARYAHIVQLQWQLAVSGRQWGAIAYLQQGWKFEWFPMDFDPALFADLVTVARDFWTNHVETKTPPEATVPGDVVKLFASHVEGKTVEATTETIVMLRDYIVAKQASDAHEKEANQLKSQIQAVIGDGESLTIDGSTVVTWRKSKDGVTLDEKRLKAERPGVYNQYLVTRSGGRRFVVK